MKVKSVCLWRQDVDPLEGEIKMTDLYTKIVLTVIAAALSAYH